VCNSEEMHFIKIWTGYFGLLCNAICIRRVWTLRYELYQPQTLTHTLMLCPLFGRCKYRRGGVLYIWHASSNTSWQII